MLSSISPFKDYPNISRSFNEKVLQKVLEKKFIHCNSNLISKSIPIKKENICYFNYLTVLDEWKMAQVTVLVKVERVNMVVVCRSADTVAHLGSHQRGSIIQKCCVDCLPVVLIQWKVG